MTAVLLASRGYGWFKVALFVLLAANAAAFAIFGRPTEALDSIAWFALLALFELETAYPQRMGQERVAALVRAGRLIAGAAVVVAAAGFLHEGEWLDAANALLWIAVVILLEFEVRYLAAVNRRRRAFAGIAGSLYSGIAVLVAIWAWRGEWFDAYDAFLWLLAFVAIELNVLGASDRQARPA